MKKELERKWQSMRKEVDEAIRAGLTANEFMELQGISRDQWYRMKPKGFRWATIQKELKIERKPREVDNLPPLPDPMPSSVKKPKPPTQNTVPETPEKPSSEKVAVVICKGSELKGLLTSLLD